MIIKSKTTGTIYTGVYIKDDIYYSRQHEQFSLRVEDMIFCNLVKRKAQIGECIVIANTNNPEKESTKLDDNVYIVHEYGKTEGNVFGYRLGDYVNGLQQLQLFETSDYYVMVETKNQNDERIEEETPRWKQGEIEENVTLTTWTCDACGFTMDAMHEDDDKTTTEHTWSCPACELHDTLQAFEPLRNKSIEWECRALAAEQSITMFDHLAKVAISDCKTAEQELERVRDELVKWENRALSAEESIRKFDTRITVANTDRDTAEKERDQLRMIIDEIQTETQAACGDMKNYLSFCYGTSSEDNHKVNEFFSIVESAIRKYLT